MRRALYEKQHAEWLKIKEERLKHEGERLGAMRPKDDVHPDQLTLFDIAADGSVSYHDVPDVARETALEAASLVSGDRNFDYGHPLDDFTKQGAMWSAILGIPVTAEQVALCMVCVKIAREVNRPKADNVVDGVGYWLTLAMIGEERRRRTGGDD